MFKLRKYCWKILVVLVLLSAASPAAAANFRVNWAQELSTNSLWRFELINESVDTLKVQQLTVTFYGMGRRFWSQQVSLSPSYLRPGESGWVTLDTSTLPKVLPLRIDWEATWNPYDVPVLQKYWNKELVASVEIDLNNDLATGSALDGSQKYGPADGIPQGKRGPGRVEAAREFAPAMGDM